MKEMVRRVREERGGFTLAELLIVVAIILVLVAIAVPIFMGALNDANDAVTAANERSLKSQANAEFLLANADGDPSGEGWGGNETSGYTKSYWLTSEGDIYTAQPTNLGAGVTSSQYTATVSKNGNDWIVSIATTP